MTSYDPTNLLQQILHTLEKSLFARKKTELNVLIFDQVNGVQG